MSRRWLRQLRAERPGAGLDQAGDGAGPDELAELADLAARVRAAVAGLADGQREAVRLSGLRAALCAPCLRRWATVSENRPKIVMQWGGGRRVES